MTLWPGGKLSSFSEPECKVSLSPPVSDMQVVANLPFVISTASLCTSGYSSSMKVMSLSVGEGSMQGDPVPSPSRSATFFTSSNFPVLRADSAFIPSTSAINAPTGFFGDSFSFLCSSDDPTGFYSISTSKFAVTSPLIPLDAALSPFLATIRVPSVLEATKVSVTLTDVTR